MFVDIGLVLRQAKAGQKPTWRVALIKHEERQAHAVLSPSVAVASKSILSSRILDRCLWNHEISWLYPTSHRDTGPVLLCSLHHPVREALSAHDPSLHHHQARSVRHPYLHHHRDRPS